MTVRRLQAVLWDVDGTLAETERDAHRVAFNRAFEECGLPWRWDVPMYGRLLRVAGGRERLLHFMNGIADAPASAADREALASRLHIIKNRHYATIVAAGEIPLRPCVLELMRECRATGIAMAIATTTSRSNVAALLGTHLGVGWHDWFGAVVCGEDVARKKPDPEVYHIALDRLKVDPRHSVAVEDSIDGTAAARAAGLRVIVTRSVYFVDAAIDGAAAIGPGLHTRDGWQPALPIHDSPTQRVSLADLDAWL